MAGKRRHSFCCALSLIVMTSSSYPIETQVHYSDIYGREIKLDILAMDRDETAYNIEVQRDRSNADPRRARFHGARIDSGLLKKGVKDFKQLPDRYVIFFTEDDVFEAGLAMYHAENRIAELRNRLLDDGGHIIYVNGKYRDLTTPIG